MVTLGAVLLAIVGIVATIVRPVVDRRRRRVWLRTVILVGRIAPASIAICDRDGRAELLKTSVQFNADGDLAPTRAGCVM